MPGGSQSGGGGGAVGGTGSSSTSSTTQHTNGSSTGQATNSSSSSSSSSASAAGAIQYMPFIPGTACHAEGGAPAATTSAAAWAATVATARGTNALPQFDITRRNAPTSAAPTNAAWTAGSTAGGANPPRLATTARGANVQDGAGNAGNTGEQAPEWAFSLFRGTGARPSAGDLESRPKPSVSRPLRNDDKDWIAAVAAARARERGQYILTLLRRHLVQDFGQSGVGASINQNIKRLQFAYFIGQSNALTGFFKPVEAVVPGSALEAGIATKHPDPLFDSEKDVRADAQLPVRAVASSAVNDLLGLAILAASAFARIDGVDGYVSAMAPGSEFRTLLARLPDGTRPERFSDIDLSPPATQRGLSDLQIIDYITGQVDRHPGNVFIDRVTGRVTGIDNDLAFGTRLVRGEYHIQFNKGLPPVVDRRTAAAVLNLDPLILQQTLASIHQGNDRLSPEQIAAAVERLITLQAHIRKLETEGRVVDSWNATTFAWLVPDEFTSATVSDDLWAANLQNGRVGYPSSIAAFLYGARLTRELDQEETRVREQRRLEAEAAQEQQRLTDAAVQNPGAQPLPTQGWIPSTIPQINSPAQPLLMQGRGPSTIPQINSPAQPLPTQGWIPSTIPQANNPAPQFLIQGRGPSTIPRADVINEVLVPGGNVYNEVLVPGGNVYSADVVVDPPG